MAVALFYGKAATRSRTEERRHARVFAKIVLKSEALILDKQIVLLGKTPTHFVRFQRQLALVDRAHELFARHLRIFHFVANIMVSTRKAEPVPTAEYSNVFALSDVVIADWTFE